VDIALGVTKTYREQSMSMFRVLLSFCLLFSLVACDPNSKAIYGEESGLPKNCRAYVQVSIDGYRNKKYTADEVMVGLERNCGANGQLWEK
jgi:hypothetical protein